MRVYRVEHLTEGHGPFQSAIPEDVLPRYPTAHRPMPVWSSLSEYEEISRYQDRRFGCESLDDLRAWFHDVVSWLDDYRFVVTEYESEDVAIANCQVAFDRATAERVSTQSVGVLKGA